jgi:hypothetical protein
MKNGYTPREFAHSIAVDALRDAYLNRLGDLEGLTPAQVVKARAAIVRLHDALAAAAKLDALSLEA